MLSVTFWIFSQNPVESIPSLFLVSILIEDLCAMCSKPSAINVSGVFQRAAPSFSRLLQNLKTNLKIKMTN